MGGSRWDQDHYHQQVTRSVQSHGTAFVHDANVNTGKTQRGVHADLDPRALKGGRRESRDSPAHPESNAVLIGLDVTGTMSSVVRQIHASLPKLMGLLTRKNYLAHPQICFCAIGDAVTDEAPLQVGQFESGAEMEGDLSKFWLEGNGGGQAMESYELFAFFGARHTSTDCLEKRGKLGYAFIIGDEKPWPKVHAEHQRQWLGATEASDIPVKAIFEELQEQYHVFVILPLGSNYGDRYKSEWAEIVGAEHVLVLPNPEAAAELIAAQIGMCEQSVDAAGLRRDLADIGTSAALVPVIERAVSQTAASNRAGIVHSDVFSSGGGSSIGRL
jgi:hypothetical protein